MAAIPVRELVTIWGFDIKDKPLKQMEAGIKGIQSSLLIVGTAAVAAAGTLFGLAKSTANAGEKAFQAAAETGVQVETLQELQFAAEQAGLAQSDLTSVLKDLSARSFDVIEGNQAQALAFRRLGVQVANSAGDLRDADEILLDLADSFQKLPDGAEKTVLAMEALGGAGAKLIPFLNMGRDGINEMRAEARRLGIVLGEDTVNASVKFNQSLKKSLAALTGLKNLMGSELLPVIKEVIDEFTEFVVTNRELIATKTRQFITGLKFVLIGALDIIKKVVKVWNGFITLLGGAENAVKLFTIAMQVFLGLKLLAGLGSIAIGLGGVVKGFKAARLAAIGFDIAALLIPVAIGLVVAAIALLVEDFIAFSEGRDSVLGRTIKVLKEDFPEAFAVLKNVFDLISSIIDNQIASWKNLFEFIKFGFNGLIDFFTDTVLPFFKDSFIGKLFEGIGSFFTSEGFNDALKGATASVKENTERLTGVPAADGPPEDLNVTPTNVVQAATQRLGGIAETARASTEVLQTRQLAPVIPPGSTNITNETKNEINNEFNINADSLTQEQATKAVESGVEKAMNASLRGAERDVEPAVER